MLILIMLLALNWLVAGALYRGPKPTTIAYCPLFLQQVGAGNVSEISSSGTGAIQGVVRRPVTVPGAAQPVTDSPGAGGAGRGAVDSGILE